MNRKRITVVLILLLIGSSVITITAQDTKKSLPVSRGDWLYVGGSGPGNYSRIQDAINNAAWFDTVFVYSGVYSEKITIDRALCLLGESRDKTIITNISNWGSLIYLSCSNITISGFTFNYSGNLNYGRDIISCPSGDDYRDIIISDNIFQANTSFGIYLFDCDFCSITHNIIYSESDAITLWDSQNCVITDNYITASEGCFGISLHESCYNRISNNTIDGGAPHGLGIMIHSADFNTISNNTLFNQSRAVYVDSSSNLTILSNYIDNPVSSSWAPLGYMGIQITDGHGFVIKGNYISRFQFGIFLEGVWGISISMNTFMKNIVHARFFNLGVYSNSWDQNYWGRPRILPKPIFGLKYLYTLYPGFVVFDWHPAQEPYDI